MENPFKGPSPYKEGDKIFGRDADIAAIDQMVRNEPLTLMFSRSGTGKSSLIKAGLLATLREEDNFVPIYIHLNEEVLRSTNSTDFSDFVIKLCIDEINRCYGFNKNFVVSLPTLRKNTLFEFITGLEITRLYDGADRAQLVKPVLIFDQFEEIFSLPFAREKLQDLLQDLRCLLENIIPQYLKDSFQTPPIKNT